MSQKKDRTKKLLIESQNEKQREVVHRIKLENTNQPEVIHYRQPSWEEDQMEEQNQSFIEHLINESIEKNKAESYRKNGQKNQKKQKVEGRQNFPLSANYSQLNIETKTISHLKQKIQKASLKNSLAFMHKKMTEEVPQRQINLEEYFARTEKNKQKQIRVGNRESFGVIKKPLNNFLNQAFIENEKKKQQEEIEIQDLTVLFPYKPYAVQYQFMKSVIQALNNGENALLQSPTGTGKTLCILCSTLSWVYQQNKNLLQDNQKVQIIYLSRTHSQLKQVQKQLEKTCFRPTISHFSSRDQSCIKDDLKGFSGRDLMQQCSKAVKLAIKQRMRQGKKQEMGQTGKQKFSPCSFYRSENETIDVMRRRFKNKLIDTEKLKNQAKLEHFCPYYYPFYTKNQTDLVFMPYNYILDVDMISRYGDLINNSIIIFDEAHNVPEAACEGRSYELNHRIFQNITLELKKLDMKFPMSEQLYHVCCSFKPAIQMIQKMSNECKVKIDKVIKQYSALKVEKVFGVQNSTTQNNKKLEEIMKPKKIREFLLQLLYPDHMNSGALEKVLTSKNQEIIQQLVERIYPIIKSFLDSSWAFIEELKETPDGIFQNIDKFLTFIKKCLDLLISWKKNEGWWEQQIFHYRLLFKYEDQEPFPFEIELICLTPSLTFADILKYQPKSIILTSGTLSPLHSWPKQLKLTFPITLVNDHVINPKQLHLALFHKAQKLQDQFNFSYRETKNRPHIYKQLASSIIPTISKIPNGVLMIFSSYKAMELFKSELIPFLPELKKSKQLCYEGKNAKGSNSIISMFKRKAQTGALLLCVCRGKVCEGIDFSDEYCRAVIFVGVPYPNIRDPIIQEKMQYHNDLQKSRGKIEKCISGDEWYTLNTMRAVNQALGRVIRHIGDYGMIFLVDNRYDSPLLKSYLPKWSKHNIKSYYSGEDIEAFTSYFFSEMQFMFREENQQRKLKKGEEQSQQKVQKQKVNAFQVLLGKKKFKRQKSRKK